MKKLLKSVISLILFTSLSSSVFALEWGGLFNAKINPSIDIVVPVTGDNLSLQQTDDLYIWMNTALNKSKTLKFNGELKYEFSWYNGSGQNAFTNIIDIDLLKLSGEFDVFKDATLSFSAGRYSISDSTGAIFSQTSDGVFASLAYPTIIFSGYLGYTGLVNNLSVKMLDGNTGEVENYNSNIYGLSHSYMPANVTVEFPVLFGNQSLSLAANAFIDYETVYNRYYANVVMTGPISNTTYYKLASSVGSINFTDLMNYTSFNLIMFPSANMSVTAGAEYASGKQLGMNKFVGFSSRTVSSSSLSPQTTGVIIPNASFSWSLRDNLYTGFTGKIIMSIPGKSVERTAAEIATDLIYNLFSDLQVGVNVDWYVPFGAVIDDSQKFSATLNVGVSF